jgi:mono/diheme cytochrome c family protein
MENKSIARLLYTINLSVLVSCLFVGVLVFSLGKLLDAPPPEVPFVCLVESPISHSNPMIPLALTEDGLKGEALFKENCGICHMPNDEALIGPGLWQVGKRRSFDWIVRWVHNPQKVIKSGDTYANELFEKFNRAEMTAFPSLNEKQIKQILAYLGSGE